MTNPDKRDQAIARVNGFGLSIAPYAPFRISHGKQGEGSLEFEHGSKYARIRVKDGKYNDNVEGRDELFDAIKVDLGPESNEWRIETSQFNFKWPAGYTLCSTKDELSPFGLVGPKGAMIFIRTSPPMPPLEDMVEPGQTVVRQSERTLEVRYLKGERSWRQQHKALELGSTPILMTVQATRRRFAAAKQAANLIAETIRTPNQES